MPPFNFWSLAIYHLTFFGKKIFPSSIGAIYGSCAQLTDFFGQPTALEEERIQNSIETRLINSIDKQPKMYVISLCFCESVGFIYPAGRWPNNSGAKRCQIFVGFEKFHRRVLAEKAEEKRNFGPLTTLMVCVVGFFLGVRDL